ncbi:bifunctional 4-hydroxy-2-oxoglutarate aldolase/2-dehydro-3-deoxy-phosphogluconate aldolase [Dactylosporangium aurantiacum]|uniref:Bifunctional 4-hydroxy-2-oxoglutarate aldolase/2-dehydro-3-deoxy-phosphogluconate aldolase n=1 Tax=Dactylosporangium aurantiacum TaxID=35754 RepID=A0A9Q9IS16_9ACTN|nr:bifunctional 4-hydroxy-2-oxoglutarate aldolase/2-dehydro-3-deoxy-phosphogluconate aldolase [Dactylosporangium aurantiacum]MDG6107659.1 bifunctional 4-hydroxy-2-oxoglutarate aldolase/2-dehydro-3-deoxy-phosphogluconate aldolase [Dactylosporangium aurantiacum]UWZ58747.1 bifunctional 4-hydroxy-2-oxoglutarate aldolase/2-dehydro-3-deoxy-phosphogluconate aldolase [Dactylosporangium aurantiacum]
MTALEEALDDALDRCPVVAIIRARTTEHVPVVLDVLSAAGITAVEIALTTPGALDAIAAARSAPRGLVIGAGTVLDAGQARAAVAAGAAYLVTPAVVPEAMGVGVPVVCGALTPTEMLAAARAGAALVKVFPIAAAGGVDYLRAVRAPLPHLPLVPTGGVAVEDSAAYLKAGARAVGIGAPLLGDAADGGDPDALAERAAALVKAVTRG